MHQHTDKGLIILDVTGAFTPAVKLLAVKNEQ